MEPHDRFPVLDDAAADVVLHLQQLQQLPLQGEGGIGGGAPGDCDAPGAATTMPRRRAPKTGGGGANTFNNIERVYSRAKAFSNRRCSVPLQSVLPTSQVCTVSSSIRTAFI